MIEDARNLVGASCLLLDEERFDEYLGLFAAQSRYSIRAYSPDLRKELALLDLDRPELETLFRNLGKHVRMPGRFLRHAGASLVVPDQGSGTASVRTAILVMHTDLEGITRIFAAGRYHDTVAFADGKALLKEREVHVDTRQFGPGSHIPL